MNYTPRYQIMFLTIPVLVSLGIQQQDLPKASSQSTTISTVTLSVDQAKAIGVMAEYYQKFDKGSSISISTDSRNKESFISVKVYRNHQPGVLYRSVPLIIDNDGKILADGENRYKFDEYIKRIGG